MDRDKLLELIPAYVLGTLEADERLQVESILATDTEAQQHLEAYRTIADALVFTTPSRKAPAAMRSKLQMRLQDSAEAQQAPPPPPIEIRHTPTRWSSYLTSAAAALIVIVLGGLLLIRQINLEAPSERELLYQQIIEQAGSQRLAAVTDIAGVEAEIVVEADGEQAVLRLAQLPVLEEDQAFQLWLIDHDTRHNGGIFQWAEGHGPYYIVMPLEKPFADYTGFGMSIEPAEGSPLGDAPTGPRVWGLAVETNSQD